MAISRAPWVVLQTDDARVGGLYVGVWVGWGFERQMWILASLPLLVLRGQVVWGNYVISIREYEREILIREREGDKQMER